MVAPAPPPPDGGGADLEDRFLLKTSRTKENAEEARQIRTHGPKHRSSFSHFLGFHVPNAEPAGVMHEGLWFDSKSVKRVLSFASRRLRAISTGRPTRTRR